MNNTVIPVSHPKHIRNNAVWQNLLFDVISAYTAYYQEEPPKDTFTKRIDRSAMPYHIMIIDDDEINNYVLRRRLETLGRKLIMTTALNGQDALNQLSLIGQKTQIAFPDLILVDLEMPIMDGFGFLQEYGQQFYEANAKTEVIVLSSSTLASDKQKLEQYDFVSRYISKPLPLSAIS